MKPMAKFAFTTHLIRWATAMLLILVFGMATAVRALGSSRDPHSADSSGNLPVNAARTSSKSNNHLEITNYFMNYAGDHSLEVATVVEQPAAGYTRYIVQLHLSSGAEQSVILTAPPGGLKVEMRDMTGDNVPNDVVLRPALLRWIPTVLVNDGHEHFNVAISGRDPSSFSSNIDLGSRRSDHQTFMLLKSSGFETVYLPTYRRLFDPQLQECKIPIYSSAASNRLVRPSSAGRAPPLPTSV